MTATSDEDIKADNPNSGLVRTGSDSFSTGKPVKAAIERTKGDTEVESIEENVLILGVSNQSKQDLKERYNLPDTAEITGLDIVERQATDVIHNLTEYPWPFEDNSFDKVIASHVVEHLPDKIQPHKEIHRILKLDGIALIKVPHFSVNNAHNLEHEHYYNHVTFNPFETPEWYGKGYPHFEIVETRLNWKKTTENSVLPIRLLDKIITPLANSSVRVAERYWHGYVGGFDEIVFKMRAVKDEE